MILYHHPLVAKQCYPLWSAWASLSHPEALEHGSQDFPALSLHLSWYVAKLLVPTAHLQILQKVLHYLHTWTFIKLVHALFQVHTNPLHVRTRPRNRVDLKLGITTSQHCNCYIKWECLMEGPQSWLDYEQQRNHLVLRLFQLWLFSPELGWRFHCSVSSLPGRSCTLYLVIRLLCKQNLAPWEVSDASSPLHNDWEARYSWPSAERQAYVCPDQI